MRAWSSGADTGIVITNFGADSGAGASTDAADGFTRATLVARFGLSGCGVTAGTSAACVVTTAGPGAAASRPEVISDPIHTPSASPPTRPRVAAEVLPFIRTPPCNFTQPHSPRFVPHNTARKLGFLAVGRRTSYTISG